MRMLTSSRYLLLAVVLGAAWSIAAWAAPQTPQRPTEKDLPDEIKAKIDAYLKARQEKAGKTDDGKTAEPKPAETKPVEGKPTVILPAEGKVKPKADATYHFEMRAKPWRDVFEWLADKTAMPFYSPFVPTGTCTFIPPAGAMYTVPQIIDIINEVMLAGEATQKYLLLRRTTMYTLVPASDKIDPHIIPQVNLAELENRGATEVVRIMITLKKQDVTTAAREYQQLASSFATVIPLVESNQLSLQDTAGNLRNIVKLIREVESDEAGQAQTFSHQCVYIRAREAERALKELLGDPAADEARDARRSPFGPQGGPGGGFQFPGGFNPGGGPGGTRGPGGPGSRDSQQTRKIHRISCDELSNKVFVTGPPDKISQARAILKEIDVAQPGMEKIIPGKVMMKTYTIPAGDAQELARLLSEKYRTSTTVRILPATSSKIIVMAMAQDQMDIAAYILEAGERGIKNEVIPVIGGDAATSHALLTKFLGDGKGGGPLLDLDTIRNAIIVRGTPEQVEEVKKILSDTGENVNSTSKIRIIPLKEGGGAALAEELQRLLPKFLDNPVNIIKPEAPKPAPKPEPDRDRENREEEDEEEALQAAPEEADQDETPAPARPAPRAASPQEKKPEKGEKKPAAPITITAVGDRIIIRSDDPDALRMAQDLIRVLTADTGKGDFQVIQLDNASAVETANLLEQMYNPQQQRRGSDPQNPLAMMFDRFGGGGSRTAQPPVEPRIRVVADPNTNSLMIRASAVDMLAIKRLLRESIDAPDVAPGAAVVRTWVMPPLKYANANEVYGTLVTVFRDFMGDTSRGGGFGTFSGRSSFPGGGRPPVDSSGNRRQSQLSIGVDDRSNSLVLSCSEKMYKDVKSLVDQLENAAKDSTKTIRVVPLDGIDPVLAQQAIDAIQGRATTSSSGSRFGGSGSPFGSGGSPFGGSSGSPFGSPFRGGNFGTPGGGGFTPGGFNPGGGGFSPGGGTFTPGSGGFGAPGSGGPIRTFTPGGGGFTPGGFRGTPGGGGGPPSGGRGRGDQSRGPDFFEYRVTDDPQVPRLYDPRETSVVHLDWSFTPTVGIHPAELVAYQDKGKLPPTGEPVRGPRSPVTTHALPEAGALIISGNNPADVDEIIRVLDLLTKINRPSQVVIRVFPLEQADATSVTSILLQLYSRVNPSPGGNIAVRSGTTPGLFGGPAGAQILPQASGSLVMIPLPRQNSILVAAPEVRMKDIEAEIKRLDIGVRPQGQARPFALKKAQAARVADLLTAFYATRYGNDQNLIRITSEATTNTVFVQAAEADLAEIRNIIDTIDGSDSGAVHELRIYKLRAGIAEEIANLINFTLAQGTVSPSLTGTRTTGAGGQFGAGTPGGGGLPGTIGGLTLPTGTGTTGATGALAGQTQGTATKGLTLRLIGREGGKPVESGNLEDARIIPDARTNSLIISAPARTAVLIEALIRELDISPAAQAAINVILLKKADAQAMGQMLQQLFLGTGTTGTGAQGAFGGLNTLQAQRPALTVAGTTAEGTPLIDLRITADPRTNSLIVAGSPSDLLVIEAITRRLDDADVHARRTEVYHLRNSTAADVAATLTNYINGVLTVFTRNNQLPIAQQLEREVVVVAESISNKLLISATPRYFDELMRIIHEIDAQPPQVVIQVLIAEVDHLATEEFGMELGLQSPVLFNRSILPGLTVNSTVNPAANPGFLFNTSAPLGNNPFVQPGVVGFQGLGNLGVGRVGANGSGLVFSASSNSFNLLLRALKTQGRVEILSRPQIMTLDNQTAQINVGQEFPIIRGQTITATGLASNDIEYRPVGVILTVTPRISPDGTVLMRVRPEVSSVNPTQVPISTTITATAFNVQTVETTVIAHDGETVGLGGLITKRDEKRENKIPWLGDLKYVGAAFRFRTHLKERRELLVILTPHIVRNRFDAARVLSDESKRIDWVLGDVLRTHGTSGMEPVLPNYQGMLQGCAPQHPQQPCYPQPSLIVPPTPAPAASGQPIYPNGAAAPGSATQQPPVFTPLPSTPAPATNAPATQRPQPTGMAPQQQAPVQPTGGVPFIPQSALPQAVIRDVTAVQPQHPVPVVPPQGYPPVNPHTQPVTLGGYQQVPQGHPQMSPMGYQPGMMPPTGQTPPKTDPGKETKWNLFQRKK